MSDILVVLVNKDNKDRLEQALRSLTNQQECRICECFDVLIMDGDSRDGSREVGERYRKKFPCIVFKVQEVKGGVGPARIEAVRYALDHNYKYIVWGDAENIYEPTYLKELTDCCRTEGDVISGKTVVRHESIWSKMFYWYHAYHLMFSYVRKRHAPGNNKIVKRDVYSVTNYVPSSRSDDFYFSIQALGKGITFGYCPSAVAYVSVPKTYEGVKFWQRSRVRGLIEGIYMLGKLFPPDLIPWTIFAIAPIGLLIAVIAQLLIPPTFLESILLWAGIGAYLFLISYLLIKLEMLAKKAYTSPSHFQGFLGLLGMYLHSWFTVIYSFKYMWRFRNKKKKLRKKALQIYRKFGFPRQGN